MARDGELDREVTDGLVDVVEALVEATDADRRARLLVRRAHGMARAACLWGEAPGGWLPLTSRGSDPSLPQADLVDAVADGQLDARGPDGRIVLVSGEPGSRIALALTGLHADEAGIDALEALLCLAGTLRAAEGGSADPLAPFGDPEGSPEDAG